MTAFGKKCLYASWSVIVITLCASCTRRFVCMFFMVLHFICAKTSTLGVYQSYVYFLKLVEHGLPHEPHTMRP